MLKKFLRWIGYERPVSYTMYRQAPDKARVFWANGFSRDIVKKRGRSGVDPNGICWDMVPRYKDDR